MLGDYEINPLIEWTVWAHLDSQTDLELILLKGHLILENIPETHLRRNSIVENVNYSFYRKIASIEKLTARTEIKELFIIYLLREINTMINIIVHDFFSKWRMAI
jgi:hypothetical protein